MQHALSRRLWFGALLVGLNLPLPVTAADDPAGISDAQALALFGAILAWLAVRYGRIGPSICAHLAFNLTAFVSLVRH